MCVLPERDDDETADRDDRRENSQASVMAMPIPSTGPTVMNADEGTPSSACAMVAAPSILSEAM